MQTEFDSLLQQSGLSVADAAKILGYSEGHIYRWRRGEETPRKAVVNVLRSEAEKRRQPSGDLSLIHI